MTSPRWRWPGGRHRAPLWPPRQAAGDVRLARRARTLDARGGGRSSLRPQWADDGYAGFASLAAIEAVQRAGGAHARCLVLVEASEESGSPHLPAHLEALAELIGTPSLVVCLDSGCNDYERLWVTTSRDWRRHAHRRHPRGGRALRRRQRCRAEHVRIARHLLERVEDVATGEIGSPELQVTIPDDCRRQAEETAGATPAYAERYRFVDDDRCRRPRRADPGPHLETHPERRRGRRVAADQPGRQRAAALDVAAAVVPPPPTCDADAALDAIARVLTAIRPTAHG